jgi:acyl carrier protein
MTHDDARTTLAAALHDVAPDVDLDAIDPDAPFQEEADIDSMDFLNLVSRLYDRAGVDIPEHDYPKLSTLSEFLAYLSERLSAPSASA